MLSYQHGYHAGGFADVIKHMTLTRLCAYLTQKENPLFYLETHAGRGLYDLHSGFSQKTGEALAGIHLLWEQRYSLCAEFTPYIQSIEHVNPNGALRFYPGSPLIALQCLREVDRLYCCELHPEEFNALNQLPSKRRRLFCDATDGIARLQALLPPKERRGLIFIDPAYEMKNEYHDIPKAIEKAYSRFSTGVYGLWYPLLASDANRSLVTRMAGVGKGRQLRIEFYLNDDTLPGMLGCGLIILNPPFVLAEEMTRVLHALTLIFNPGKSHFLVERG